MDGFAGAEKALKLTAHITRVKQVSILHLFLASALTGIGLILLWSLASDEEAHIDQFGSAIVSALSNQAVDPLVDRDLIHLGVLINRITALPAVTGASIHGMDNEPLALSGDLRRGLVFTEQVVGGGKSLGVVRIHVDESRFDTGLPGTFLLASLIWAALVPLVVLGAGQISLSALDFRQFRQRRDEAEEVLAAIPEPDPEPCFLIAVNLFNQLSLTPEQCARELAFARMTAERVAALHHGEVLDLPGTGLLLAFDGSHSDDRPFHVLCAAFALSRLLADADSFGRYRLGVHMLILEADEALSVSSDPVKDAAVLSALARDNTIIASRALVDRVPYQQRVVLEPMNHPLLEELETIGGGAALARALAAPHDDLITQQLLELKGESDADDATARADQLEREGPSTARESTF
jgi:hypothetical protein